MAPLAFRRPWPTQLSPIVQHQAAATEQALQRLGRTILITRLHHRWRVENDAERTLR